MTDDPEETIGEIRELYSYDSRNQLIRHDSKTHDRTWLFSYDLGGNILQKTEYAYTTGTPGTPLSTVTYTYGTGAAADRVTNFNGSAVTYDGLGNITSIGSRTFAWDGRNLTGISDTGLNWSAAYGAGGIRLSKTVNGTETRYYTSGSRILAQVTGSNKMWFVYDNVGKAAGVVYNGTAYYYMYNVQGDVIAIVNCSTGKVVATYEYDAWGCCTVTCASGSTIGNVNPIRYRGYYYDVETGLYYLNGRYYAPEMCRFIAPDDTAILTISPTTLTNKNLYAYCDNNPVVREDSDGKCGLLITILAAAAVGFVVGVAGQVVSDITQNLLNGTNEHSSLGTYIGAGIGGAAGVVATTLTGNPALAGAITGGVTTFAADFIDKVSGKTDMTWKEIALDTAIDTVAGAAFGSIPVYASVKEPLDLAGYKVPKLNAIKNAILSKSELLSTLKPGEFIKNFINSLPLDAYYGKKQAFLK